jgi:NitT/TauT family transport system substrate-binding protein
MSSANADLGGLWAPNIYTLEEKSGGKVLCSGKEGGVVVPGALIARGDYAEQNPENVAKFLAVYLRAWKWANANQPQAIAMMRKFYEQGGVTISDASLKKEFDTRPTFDLATQIARMDRSRGNSDMDAWFGQIAIFMRGTGAIQTVPQPTEFITDAYMKRVATDPKLREFANKAN